MISKILLTLAYVSLALAVVTALLGVWDALGYGFEWGMTAVVMVVVAVIFAAARASLKN